MQAGTKPTTHKWHTHMLLHGWPKAEGGRTEAPCLIRGTRKAAGRVGGR